MNRRGTGWRANSRKFNCSLGLPTGPEEPSIAQWDKLLGSLEIDDMEALRAIDRETAVGARLRLFVRRNFTRRYVPEAVLNALDLCEAADLQVVLHEKPGDRIAAQKQL